MKIESELINATKKLSVVESQLERTLRQLERDEYGEGWKSDLFTDILHAKDKIIEAREALEGRIP